MSKKIIGIIMLFSAASYAVGAELSPFHDSLNGVSSIVENNGVIYGNLAFVSGMKGNSAKFNGNNTYVEYPNTLFNAESGSITLWFRKNSSDTAGGVFQIGQLGTPNSIGLFYNYNTGIYFEIRNSSTYAITYKLNTLSQSEFVHIAISWDKRGNEYHIKLFINGEFIDGNILLGSFALNQGCMELGRVGYYGYGDGTIDELRFFDWALSDPEVYAEYVHSSSRYVQQKTGKPVSTGKVKLINKALIVNNVPFKVKGVGYQPIPVGFDNNQTTHNTIYTDPAIIQRDLVLLRNMNVNTVRLWGKLQGTTLLDALYNNGNKPIYAILGFEIPVNADYTDSTFITSMESEFKSYVNKFKGHEAVLAWGIGNENNLHYKGSVSDWFLLANRLAKVAYEAEEPDYHPTILINGYMLYFGNKELYSDDASLNYVDMWGHNSYTGFEFHSYFKYYDAISAKPLVITEFGIDSFDNNNTIEYQDIHRDWVVHQWRQVEKACTGGTLMEYNDEWWKAGNIWTHDQGGYYTDVQPDGYSNEEWWGIMAIQDNGSGPDIMVPRLVYDALKLEFNRSSFNTWHVDGNNTTGPWDGSLQYPFQFIQDGLCASSYGDTIEVKPGTYHENIDFLGKSVVVESEQGSDLTVIDGMQTGSSVIFKNQEGFFSRIEGFTIKNGSGTYDPTMQVYGGGGIYCKSSSPVITSNKINMNLAGRGGGIWCHEQANPIISNNIISDNEVGSYGGGICCNSSNPEIYNNVLIKNRAGTHLNEGRGGGIYCESSSPSILNNTITDNTILQIGHGGGISCTSLSFPTVINTILWDNAAPTNSEIHVESGSSPDVRYCDIKNGFPGNNINENPQLKVNDYHLEESSPCINRGTNDEAPVQDIDGEARPYMGTVDIGADEFVGNHRLEADGFTISESIGGSIQFYLNGGIANAFRNYLLLGGITDTIPGTPLPGGIVTLPLNWDIFTNLVTQFANTPLFLYFLGSAGSYGEAVAIMNMPPVPGALGMSVYFAYAMNSPWDFVSNPVVVRIVE